MKVLRNNNRVVVTALLYGLCLVGLTAAQRGGGGNNNSNDRAPRAIRRAERGTRRVPQYHSDSERRLAILRGDYEYATVESSSTTTNNDNSNNNRRLKGLSVDKSVKNSMRMMMNKVPTEAPTPSPSSTFAPTVPGGTVTVELPLQFFQLPALETVFTNYAAPDAQDLGTVYIYNDVLYNQTTLNELNNSFVTGHCIRTQQRQTLTNGFVVGAGYCHFTYTISDDTNSQVTFNAAGEVFDQFGGLLAIAGGTGILVGVTGEVQLSPVDLTNSSTSPINNSGDFFTDPTGYEANATLIVTITNTSLLL